MEPNLFQKNVVDIFSTLFPNSEEVLIQLFPKQTLSQQELEKELLDLESEKSADPRAHQACRCWDCNLPLVLLGPRITKFPLRAGPPKRHQEVPKMEAKTQEITRIS